MGVILVSASEFLATDLPSELKDVARCSISPADSHYSSNTSTVPHCFQNSTGHSKSTDNDDDEATEQKHTVWLFTILASVAFVFFVFVFRPKYRRVDSERRASFEQSTYVGAVNR